MKNCPKGQRWCPIKKECIPDAEMMKGHGRGMGRGQGQGPMGKPYKVNESDDIPEDEKIKELGMDKDEMRKTMTGEDSSKPKKVDESKMEKLVNIILDGKYDTFKRFNEGVKLLDKSLREIENELDNIPDQDLESIVNKLEDDISSDEEKLTIKNPIKESLKLFLTEEDYRDYFRSMMKRYNISSPSQLSKDRKKTFFNDVSKGWKKIKKQRKK